MEVAPLEAEAIIANMIMEKRVNAVLDQKASVVEFENESHGLNEWESQAALLCQSVEKLVEDIVKAHPN